LANFMEDRQIARDHGHARRQCFDDRKPESFGTAGKQDRACSREMRCEILVGAIVQFDDMTSKSLIPIDDVEHTVSLPSSLTDDEQSGSLIAQARHEARPNLQKKQMVLPALDRAECNECRRFGFLCFATPSRQLGASKPRGCRRWK
jgi:hypothetical protein